MSQQALEVPLPDGSALQPLRTGHVRIDRPPTLQGRTPAAARIVAEACQRGWEVVCAPAPHPGVGPFFETIGPGPHAGLVAYVHAELQRRQRRQEAAGTSLLLVDDTRPACGHQDQMDLGEEPLLLVLDDRVANVPGRQTASPVVQQLLNVVRLGRRFGIIVALEVTDTDPPWSAPPYLPATLRHQLTTRLTVDGAPRPEGDLRCQPSRPAPAASSRRALAVLRVLRRLWPHRRTRQQRRPR